MDEFRTVWRKMERKTYLKGTLRGKYIGFLKKEISDLAHENFFDIEILEAEIVVEKNDISKWDQGEFQDYKLGEVFLTKLPTNLPCAVNLGNGVQKNFNINLFAPKVFNTRLSERLQEGEQVFGTIEGDISGYLVHQEMESFKERIPIPKVNTVNPENIENLGNEGLSPSQTGKPSEGNNIAPKNDNQPSISRNENPVLQDSPKSIWKTISELLQLGAILAFTIPILYSLRYFLGIIAAWIAVYFLTVFIQPVLRFFGRVLIGFLGIAFVVLFCIALINFLSNGRSLSAPIPVIKDTPSERTQNDIIPSDQGISDSIVVHHREWSDYDGRNYTGNIQVRISDFRESTQFRNELELGVSYSESYEELVNLFHQHDQGKLSGLYKLLDSIKVAKQLNEMQFAEMAVSCIQDIPYTLILDDVCSPWKYNDVFIKDYLLRGGKCRPFTKYGLLTPVEFMATLDGDCDTRSLLLYSILKHYRYDVLMLVSTYYRHAAIAINLPYSGIAKFYDGKRYVVWETTQRDIKPGIFSSQFSDMRFWTVTLPLPKNK
jgi:hypothetical protein